MLQRLPYQTKTAYVLISYFSCDLPPFLVPLPELVLVLLRWSGVETKKMIDLGYKVRQDQIVNIAKL